MPSTDTLILEAARDYTRTARALLAALRAQQGTTGQAGHPWNRPRFPRSGPMGQGLCYAFHGAGCAFSRAEDGEEVLDLDFDGDFGASEFDAWRLWSFAGEKLRSSPQLGDWRALAARLEALAEAGPLHRGTREGRYRLTTGEAPS